MKYRKKSEDKGRNLPVCLDRLINEVIVAPRTPDWVTEAIKSMVQEYGFDFEVNPSTLLDEPFWMRQASPQGITRPFLPSS